MPIKLEKSVTEKSVARYPESWKEKYARLQEEVSQLQNELACARETKSSEALVVLTKTEMEESLLMALKESSTQKQELLEK